MEPGIKVKEEADDEVALERLKVKSFMELLGEGDDLLTVRKEEREAAAEEGKGFLFYPTYSSSSFSSSTSPATTHMLCFGGAYEEEEHLLLDGIPLLTSASSLSTLSSPPPTTRTTATKPKATRKDDGKGKVGGGRKATASADTSTASASKKPKAAASRSPRQRTTTVRKEKVGERIMALQQLVSPFGKTDTASVLHEALRYIKLLHDQVQVLSAPYLQHLPSSGHRQHEERGMEEDLSSRGLCLVPVSCTENVAYTNSAHLRSPRTAYPFGSKH